MQIYIFVVILPFHAFLGAQTSNSLSKIYVHSDSLWKLDFSYIHVVIHNYSFITFMHLVISFMTANQMIEIAYLHYHVVGHCFQHL